MTTFLRQTTRFTGWLLLSGLIATALIVLVERLGMNVVARAW